MFGQISGTVVDVEGNPIAYANVMVYSTPDSKLQTGVITNENGDFSVEWSNPSTYILNIDLLSFASWTSEPFTISEVGFKMDFGTITLEEELMNLEGVEVRGRRRLIQRTQEGSIINVQASVLTQGSTALQLLERSPGVILDQYNNTFSLNGKSGTLIIFYTLPCLKLPPLAFIMINEAYFPFPLFRVVTTKLEQFGGDPAGRCQIVRAGAFLLSLSHLIRMRNLRG